MNNTCQISGTADDIAVVGPNAVGEKVRRLRPMTAMATRQILTHRKDMSQSISGDKDEFNAVNEERWSTG